MKFSLWKTLVIFFQLHFCFDLDTHWFSLLLYFDSHNKKCHDSLHLSRLEASMTMFFLLFVTDDTPVCGWEFEPTDNITVHLVQHPSELLENTEEMFLRTCDTKWGSWTIHCISPFSKGVKHVTITTTNKWDKYLEILDISSVLHV